MAAAREGHPLYPVAAAPPPRTGATDMSETGHRVIHVVDDDRGVRFVLATALRDAGYEILESATAEQALRDLRGRVSDLLLCDVRLPGADGLALLREVKAAHPDLPVIVMSAYTDVATTAAAYREGAVDYLPQALGPAQALASVQRAPAEAAQPEALADATGDGPELLGDSAPMREVFRLVG